MDKEKAERIIKIVNWVRYIILAVFLTFLFATLSKAQTTHDFGIWYSAGMEKKISADWNVGIGTELRTKHRREYIDRWKLDIHSMYRILRHLKLGAAYEFHLKNQTTGSGTVSVPHHRFMADAVPAMSVNGWLHLSLRERYQYTYRMAKDDIDARHKHHLRSRMKAVIATARSKWKPFASAEVFNNMRERFTIDEIRLTAGTGYRFSPHHSVNIGYMLNLKRSTDSLDKMLHALTTEYIYNL
ncbi:MAG: DUF2490 domain-containing protein [Paludibacteraceae bacterium]|nr:DUF2490 domain-containing protein [Paludibacteraceae bacterium]MBQ8715160.1 DUF2490 domain-containing protein [Prevotella sp.]